MGTAPDAAIRLVDHFDQNRKVFLSGDYKEEQLRVEFDQRTYRLRVLNHLFESNGWDASSRAGLDAGLKHGERLSPPAALSETR